MVQNKLGQADEDDLLLEGADESSLLQDFEKVYCDSLVPFEDAMMNDAARDSVIRSDVKLSKISANQSQPQSLQVKPIEQLFIDQEESPLEQFQRESEVKKTNTTSPCKKCRTLKKVKKQL